jgi:aminobenzoyl-glutamate utilization protein A
MSVLADTVASLAESLLEDAIADRRDLHQYPETAWTEFRSTARVIRRLQRLGWEVRWGRSIFGDVPRMGLPGAAELQQAFDRALAEGAPPELLQPMRDGYTGCIADLTGASTDGPTVALRFDIDALPVTEASDDAHQPAQEGYASRHAGQMHACGHDSHAAMGLGVASLLAAMRDQWSGRVRLIFQPGEEGTRGAAAMVAAGLLDGADYFLSPHVGAQSHVTGEIIPGITGFLATRKVDVSFLGREAHAGLAPQEGRNALLAAALATMTIFAIPRHSGGNSRINVGVLRAGSGRNVIASEAQLQLELRGDSNEVVEYLEAQARAVVEGAAHSQGVESTFEVVGEAPSAASDPDVMEAVARVARLMPGVREIGQPRRAEASDDATAMMRRVQEQGGKAAYVIVGSQLPDGHHTPHFDIDEQVMAGGIGTLAGAALELLRRGRRS